ncbi:DUF3530 family protein [Cocleimonas sp. KMM 6892]|uniref:DUF3530 family protein n=1 Tax=unclassified Cocleimonas TaxID=2639732 RepID=UPI002DB7D86F|nr:MULTISPECIES: DUF3530 family protein [unclassified Cocleimonas]MEB8431598.1 DUF3530 family protein [Cocleimonas sp. KMM 6892]MEC4713630.1 DUF3530 family protein [Cocleimonas sp. KMM 6895]MEC4742961.1 DUF3530 family protein [Cocleimonas sp. KMM 6896]
MKNKRHLPTYRAFFALALTCLFSVTSVFASDLEKEKRWAEQISDSLFDGEAIELNDGSNDFLAIDTRADEPSDVAVIVIHGIGIHPDWETVVKPLRVELAEKGWNTLSLQMPVLANDADSEDYEPLMKEVPARIDAGIRYLAKEGAKKVVIVAHSLGARMANYYLSHKKVYKEAHTETPIIAYIGIGMNTDNEQFLKNIKIPVLDLYGEKDLEGVLSSTETRKQAASQNKGYKQQKIAGANHFFEGHDDDLVNAVVTELQKY